RSQHQRFSFLIEIIAPIGARERKALFARGSAPRPSLLPLGVLLVRDLLHPSDSRVVLHFGNGDMGHRAVGRRAVPVLLARLEPDDVAGPDLLDRAALPLRAPETGGDKQRLPERVRMPRGARARLEGDSGR